MGTCTCRHDGRTVTGPCMMHAEWARVEALKTINVTTIEGAQEAKRDLEIGIMKLIHSYEGLTGLRITKASMEHFQDARFFNTHAVLPPMRKKEKDNG
jgi:hypothetical protein